MVMYRRHSSKDNFLTDKGIGWIDSGSTFRLSVAASLSRVFLLSTGDSSHSHTTITFHPSASRAAASAASRSLFLRIFSVQNSTLLCGSLNFPHPGCPCQKHPFTNITV